MKVAMVDLLAQVPFYDRYLSQGLSGLVQEYTLYTGRLYHEPGYLDGATFDWSPGRTDWLGLSLARVKAFRRVARALEYNINWQSLLKKFSLQPPDIVHIQWVSQLGAAAFLSEVSIVDRLHRMRIPVVYTVHNYLPHETSPHLSRAYHRFYTRVDHLIVHTTADQQRLCADGIEPDRISVVPQGPAFADGPIRPAPGLRRSLDTDHGDFVLLMLGMVRPYKGTEAAIRALALTASELPNLRLWVIGKALNSRYARQLQELAEEQGVGHMVRWRMGFVPSHTVAQYHAAADAVLFPYLEISQSAAFLTAAGLGKLTISTRVGGMAEVVRDGVNGIQVASAEPKAVAEGITRCVSLTPAQRAAMGLRLQQDVLQSASWDLIARRTVSVYEAVLRRAQSAAPAL